MPEESTEKKIPPYDRKDQLANERTFLAWIRTNLGIMAFGFVVEKFSFFTGKITAFLGKTESTLTPTQQTIHGYSFIFGITIIGVGALLSLLAFFKFKKTENAIQEGLYPTSLSLDIFLTLFVFSFGIFLILYLIITSI